MRITFRLARVLMPKPPIIRGGPELTAELRNPHFISDYVWNEIYFTELGKKTLESFNSKNKIAEAVTICNAPHIGAVTSPLSILEILFIRTLVVHGALEALGKEIR